MTTTPQHSEQAERRQFAAYWVKAQPLISSFISSAVRDVHHAEDLLQDVAQAAAVDFATYDRSRPFVAWALGIARHRVLNYLRKQSRDRHVFDDQTLNLITDAHGQIDGEVEERKQALDRCLSRLTGKGRKIVEMRYLRELNSAQIAEHMGMTCGAVFTMLHRVRAALRRCIDEQLTIEEAQR